MRFLVSTDNHCGYGEVKKTTYNDAFNTLDEVFENAHLQNVDFVLLGGDLFHDNNPSRETRIRVMRTLRKYTLEGAPTELEFVSRPENSFSHSAFKCVNFEDENLCVSIPIFSIHGNHDDLSGTSTSALDVLHEAGLLNLFGRFPGVNHYVVDPILLQKKQPDGSYEKLAIYGISSQRDDRLARAFEAGNVVFRRPSDAETWSSILVLHQNRPRRSTLRTTGSFVNIQKLPTFFNLIIWGHEHESIVEPEFIRSEEEPDTGYWVLQPGSTVATSLTADEAKPKHCFVVEFHGNNTKPDVIPIPLITPRQLFYEEIDLQAHRLAPPCENVRLDIKMEDERMFSERVNALLDIANDTYNPRQPRLPLMRVKIIYSGAWKKVPPLSARKVGSQFVGQVVNASEILSIQRERTKENRRQIEPLGSREIRTDEKAAIIIQKLVADYFENASGQSRLKVLKNDAMFAAVSEYNSSTSKASILDSQLKECIRSQVKSFQDKLKDLTSAIELGNEDASYKEFEEHLEKIVGNDEFSQSQMPGPISQFSEYQPVISQSQSRNGSVNGDTLDGSTTSME